MVGIATFVVVVALIVVVVIVIAKRLRAPKPPGPRPDSRLSLLAAFCFLCGLAAMLAVLGAAILHVCSQARDILSISDVELWAVLAATKVLLYCTLAPAVGTLGFWLGARSVIRDSQGALRGMALYRWGVMLTILSVALAFGSMG